VATNGGSLSSRISQPTPLPDLLPDLPPDLPPDFPLVPTLPPHPSTIPLLRPMPLLTFPLSDEISATSTILADESTSAASANDAYPFPELSILPLFRLFKFSLSLG
jgi:hypothetical protein